MYKRDLVVYRRTKKKKNYILGREGREKRKKMYYHVENLRPWNIKKSYICDLYIKKRKNIAGRQTNNDVSIWAASRSCMMIHLTNYHHRFIPSPCRSRKIFRRERHPSESRRNTDGARKCLSIFLL